LIGNAPDLELGVAKIRPAASESNSSLQPFAAVPFLKFSNGLRQGNKGAAAARNPSKDGCRDVAIADGVGTGDATVRRARMNCALANPSEGLERNFQSNRKRRILNAEDEAIPAAAASRQPVRSPLRQANARLRRENAE